ncbi:MAG: aryl-sulfate sulfotransferase [Bacteroidales bacterium]
MRKTKLVLVFLIAIATQTAISQQQTVGIFFNTPEAFNGYTLFSPLMGTTTYLIDNCGEVVHKWESTRTPGLKAYLTADGKLVRAAASYNTVFNGRWGGTIEVFNWEGDLIWEYVISDNFKCQHHDIECLPNGNILAVVWELHSLEEVIQAGRVDAESPIWSEKIVEIQPDYENGTGTVVWEWRTWDHLIQDVNPNLDNYGVVADNPQRVDINYLGEVETATDWLHFNSVYHNAELDQIVITVHNLHEIWIVDHSTTTEEAASSTGGNCGKGGDLLYRWGNPLAYKRGTESDQQLFLPHDANWIPQGQMDEGMIMIYDNQAGTPYGLDYSAVDVIDPPLLDDGNYQLGDAAYAPTDPYWTYTAENPTDFYSDIISGARRLPNNNTLICEGMTGRLFEVDYEGNTVWQYINPIGMNGITPQYGQPQINAVFKVERYAPDFEGFEGRELIPQGHIEPGTTVECEIYDGVNVEGLYTDGDFDVFPNPASSLLNVQWDYANVDKIQFSDIKGNLLIETSTYTNGKVLDVSCFSEGLYIVSLFYKGYFISSKQVVVK